MTFAVVALVATLWGQPSPKAAPQTQLRVQKLFVPRESVGKVLPEALKPNDPVHIRSYEDFHELLQRYNQRQGGMQALSADVCRLTATFDPQTQGLFGSGVIESSSDKRGELILSPWNLPLVSPATDDSSMNAAWGINANGDLCVSSAPEGGFTFEWRLAPTAVQRRQYRFELRTPACGVAHLDLTLPPEWGLRTSYRVVSNGSPQSYRILFNGAPGLSLEILPRDAMQQPQSVLTWMSRQVMRFDETSTLVDVDVRLESLHEPTPSVSFLLDRALAPVKESVPVQRWRREETAGAAVRWTAEFRRPPLGRFDVTFSASFPTPPDSFVHPLLVHVERGLPRGESLDFSIDGSLRIAELDPGGYRGTFAGVDQDGRYHVELTGLGMFRWDVGTVRFESDHVSDWLEFFRRLHRQANGGDASPAGQLFRRFTEPTQQLLQTVVESSSLDDASRQQLIDAVNEPLASADLFDAAGLSGRGVEAEALRLLARRAEGLSPTQIAWANRLVVESIASSLLRVSVASARPPTVKLATGRPDVDVQLESQLRLQRDQMVLTAFVTWRCHQGTVYQPQLHVPRGWEVSTVRRMNSTDRQGAAAQEGGPAAAVPGREIQFRLQPSKAGDSVLWLELDQWLVERKELSVQIEAHPQESPPPGSQGPLFLPEIRPVGFPFGRPSVYTIVVDADVPYSLKNLPQAKLDAAPMPRTSPIDPEGEQHVFEYESPLEVEPVQLAPQSPRFAAIHQQTWEWNGSNWRADLSMEVAFQQGAVDSFDVETTEPLPEDSVWSLDTANNRVKLELLSPPTEDDPLYRYRLHLEVPVRRTTRLSTSWNTTNPQVVVPLLHVLGADRFRGDVKVQSQTGQVIEVNARRLAQSEVLESLQPPTSQWLIFHGNYFQVLPDSRLELTVSSPATDFQQHIGSAYLHYYSSVKDDRVVEHLFAWLDCRKRGRLTLYLPGDYHLWSVVLDGETVQPWTSDGAIELPEELAPGIHSLEMTYSHTVASHWGARRIELPPPLWGWRIESLVYEVEHSGNANLLPGPNLELTSMLKFGGQSCTGQVCALGTDSPFAASVAATLESDYAALPEHQKLDLPSLLIELQRSFGVIPLAVDEPVVARSESRVAKSGSAPTSLAAWLAERDLVIMISPKCCVLTSRIIVDAFRGRSSRSALDTWLDRMAERLRNQGVNATGRFVSAVQFAARYDHRVMTAASPALNHRAGASPIQLWTMVAKRQQSPSGLSVTLIANHWLRRSVYVGSVLFLIVSGLLVWKLPLRWLKIGALMTLIPLMVLAVVGSPLERAFAIPGWVALIALLVGFFVRSLGSSTSIAVALATVLVLHGSAAAQNADVHRVIVPVDPEGIKQVFVPQSLLQLLESPPTNTGVRFLLRSADYQGELQPDQQLKWRATLVGVADERGDYPATASFGFGGVGVDAVRVNGVDVQRFRPAAGAAGLDIEISQPGPQTIEVDFRTPLLGNQRGREVAFRIPPCAQNTLRLQLGQQPVSRLRLGIPGTLEEQNGDAGAVVVGNLGYANQIQLSWMDGPRESQGPPVFTVSSAQLLDIREEVRDLLSIFRFQIAEGEIGQLQWAISPELVVWRVDPDNLLSWEIKEDPSGRFLIVTPSTPQTDALDVRIHAMLRYDRQSTVDFPKLIPLNARSEEGMLGVIIPKSWRLEETTLRNAEPATAADFSNLWERLGGKPPGDLALAKHFRQRPLQLSLTLQPMNPSLQVSQTFQIVPNPVAKGAEVNVRLDLEVQPADRGVLQFKVPRGLELQRIEGDDVYQWYQQGDWVTLLPQGAARRQRTIQVKGRWRSAVQRGNANDPVTFDFAGFEWPRAGSTSSQWRIAKSEDWTAAAQNLVNVASESPGRTSALELSSESDRHSFRVTLNPVLPEAEVRGAMLISLANDKAVYEGRIELRFQRGRRRRFRVSLPRQLESVRWLTPTVGKPFSVPKGEHRMWTVEPEASSDDAIYLDWRGEQRLEAILYADAPHVEVEGFPFNSEIVALRSPRNLVSPVASGLAPFDQSEGPAGWPLDQLQNAPDQSLFVYRTESPDWRLQIRKRSSQPVRAHPKVRNAQADVVISGDGSMNAVSRWEILNETGGVVVVALPDYCQPSDLRLDGRSVRFPNLNGSKLQFPIQARAGWQSVAFYWTFEQAGGVERFTLPAVQVGDSLEPENTLVRVRLAAGMQLDGSGPTLTREEWCMTRLRHLLVSLREVLEFRRRSEPDAYAEAVVLDRLTRWKSQRLELEELLRVSPTAESAREAFSEVQQQFDNLVREFGVQSLVDDLEGRAVVSSEPNQVLDWAVSARTEYLLAPPTYVFRFRADDSWWAKATSSADWVWLATSLLGFAVLGLARFEKVALRFWPTVCFPLSVLWIRWSQNPGLGWLLFAVCTFAAAWMVRGWFVHTTIRSSISVSTVLKQELSKFTSLGSESGKQR